MLEKIKYFINRPLQLPIVLLTKLSYFGFIRNTLDYQNKINFETWFIQKILNIGGNRKCYWPVHYSSQIFDPENIYAGIDTCPGLMRGCYIQGMGGIYIGDYTQIAPHVVIVSANHDIYDIRKHIKKKVVIGKYCWIGAGAKILPGITLGDFTIVGAGSVVTKSFSEGYNVIAGNPAKIIHNLEMEKCIQYHHEHEYNGYIPHHKFEKFRKEFLNV